MQDHTSTLDLHSVLCLNWLDDKNGIWPVKNRLQLSSKCSPLGTICSKSEKNVSKNWQHRQADCSQYKPKQAWSHSRWSTQHKLVLLCSDKPSQLSAASVTQRSNAMQPRPYAAAYTDSAYVPDLMQMPENITWNLADN